MIETAASSDVQNGYTPAQKAVSNETFEPLPLLRRAILTYLSYGILIILGHISDLLMKLGVKSTGYKEALKKNVRSTIYVRPDLL